MSKKRVSKRAAKKLKQSKHARQREHAIPSGQQSGAQQWKDETKRFLENYRNVSHDFGSKSYHFINEGNNFHESKINNKLVRVA